MGKKSVGGDGPLEKPGSRANGAEKRDVERILLTEWSGVEDNVESVGRTENARKMKVCGRGGTAVVRETVLKDAEWRVMKK